MESIYFKTFIAILLAFVVYITGIFLRKKGEPYKKGTLAVHKISVVGLVVFVVLIYIQHFKAFDFEGIGLTIFILSSLFFIVAFISGVLLSFEKIVKYKWKWIHIISSVLTLLIIFVIWFYCH